ncbi:MAG: nucleotidyl transferase AbiEii/AbiGii toxin family protein, partial [Bacteroidetes bacterium]
EEIKKSYPLPLHAFGDFLLREYLQYLILRIIYDSGFASKLIFIGGTCLRILHNNSRFSEDLDFDIQGLTEKEWDQLAGLIREELIADGYQAEVKMVHKGAWHCYIRFPGLLFGEGLSGYREQKILIQLDAEAQHYSYQPQLVLLNKFDIFTEVFAAPLPLILAQKYYAILNRVRNKGRDFFDVSFLLGMNIAPDWAYLELKTGITNTPALKSRLLAHCEKLDMEEMARDVAPFLFRPQDARRVTRFRELVEQL